MCNCGKKRNGFESQEYLQPNKTYPLNKSFQTNNTHKSDQSQKNTWTPVSFEYIGNTGLTVTGSVTGKRYRYNKKGEVQLIDYRDCHAMMQVPVLKKVR